MDTALRYTLMQTCQSCGQCCNGHEVQLNEGDIVRLEKFLKLDRSNFTIETENTFPDGRLIRRLMLNDDLDPVSPNQSCVFLEEKEGQYSCLVYNHRPIICQLFPRIPKHLETCKRLNPH